MAQITTGIRSILSQPWAYDALQGSLGVTYARRVICRDYIDAHAGQVVVDVGCGTAEILKFLPEGIDYYGFDLSPEYIASAKRRFGDRWRFECRDITEMAESDIPPCDVAISFGVLHHLDDNGARGLMGAIYDRLAPGGKLVTVDPVFEPGQARIALELIRRDRGQNVRTTAGYLDLVPAQFRSKEIEPRHDLLRVPYTYAVMVSTR